MARNRLAGTRRGKSRSAKYYQKNPKARAKKNRYNKKYHSTGARKKYRKLLQAINRKKGTHGNMDCKDESHTSSGKTVKEHFSKNRARNRGVKKLARRIRR